MLYRNVIFCVLFCSLNVWAADLDTLRQKGERCMLPSAEVPVVGTVFKASEYGKDVAQKPEYCEYHSPVSESHKQVIKYKRHDGTLIAQKQLDFSISSLLPSVQQEDFRFGEARVARVEGDYWQVSYLPQTSKKRKSKRLSLGDVSVVDAGFDSAIRAEWDRLLSGASHRLQFLSVPHVNTIRLKVQKKKQDECMSSVVSISEVVCFVVAVDSLLLRMFAQPLKLTYDKNSRQLLTYKGVVNVLSDKKETFDAVIVYRYF